MDSLTQIVLGAAAGEVVLGKKIGNRAMVWGAVAGTIPDLDVLGKFFLSNIDNLAFHRGISHSISFCIIGAIAFGWLVHRIYQSQYHKWIAIFFKTVALVLVASALNFVFERFFPGNYIPLILISSGLGYLLYSNSKRKYFDHEWQRPTATMRDWQWLFFWGFLTHTLLDCFTIYGTQLFAPFSSMRVAWGTIAVADPLYTIPFLICLIIASWYIRESKKRRIWNYLGIALSSLYLLFTVWNKQQVNQVFASAIEKQGIEAERFIINPYILNNVVWGCTAESEDHYYIGQYSLFDEVDIQFNKIEKNHDLLKGLDTDPTIQTLRWFCNDYFVVTSIDQGFQFSDLRFGTFTGEGNSPDDFIFRFMLKDEGESGYYMEEAVGGPPEGKQQEIMANLWERIQGRKK